MERRLISFGGIIIKNASSLHLRIRGILLHSILLLRWNLTSYTKDRDHFSYLCIYFWGMGNFLMFCYFALGGGYLPPSTSLKTKMVCPKLETGIKHVNKHKIISQWDKLTSSLRSTIHRRQHWLSVRVPMARAIFDQFPVNEV